MICKPWIERSEWVRSVTCEYPSLARHSLKRIEILSLVDSRNVYRLIATGTLEENMYERQCELERKDLRERGAE
jgi:hypothetical protein